MWAGCICGCKWVQVIFCSIPHMRTLSHCLACRADFHLLAKAFR